MTQNSIDPRGLIEDAYNIEGISAPECRSIFLDWALEPREDGALPRAAAALSEKYAPLFPDHPMTGILADASATLTTAPKRRGGRKGR